MINQLNFSSHLITVLFTYLYEYVISLFFINYLCHNSFFFVAPGVTIK